MLAKVIPAPWLLVSRSPAIQFLLTFDHGVKLGYSGVPKELAWDLMGTGLVDVYHYKPYNRKVRIPRHFLAIAPTDKGRFFTILLRDELRQSNLAAATSIQDGVGMAAMRDEWSGPNQRRAEVKAAAERAWRRFAEAQEIC